MEEEQQVTSLELSKKLKEFGVKQESLYHWNNSYQEMKGDSSSSTWNISNKIENKKLRHYSAFTVGELWDLFPQFLRQQTEVPEHLEGAIGGELGMHKNDPKNGDRDYTFVGYGYATFSDDIPANACAKMLIYLIENKLLPPQTL